MARIHSYAVAGVPPEIMGIGTSFYQFKACPCFICFIGPVPAMTQALERAGLTFDDMVSFSP